MFHFSYFYSYAIVKLENAALRLIHWKDNIQQSKALAAWKYHAQTDRCCYISCQIQLTQLSEYEKRVVINPNVFSSKSNTFTLTPVMCFSLKQRLQ